MFNTGESFWGQECNIFLSLSISSEWVIVTHKAMQNNHHSRSLNDGAYHQWIYEWMDWSKIADWSIQFTPTKSFLHSLYNSIQFHNWIWIEMCFFRRNYSCFVGYYFWCHWMNLIARPWCLRRTLSCLCGWVGDDGLSMMLIWMSSIMVMIIMFMMMTSTHHSLGDN